MLLQQAITPYGAVRPVETKKGEAARVRDQLCARGDPPRCEAPCDRAGAFEGEADVVVPPLQSRAVTRKSDAVVVTDPLAPTPVTPTRERPARPPKTRCCAR